MKKNILIVGLLVVIGALTILLVVKNNKDKDNLTEEILYHTSADVINDPKITARIVNGDIIFENNNAKVYELKNINAVDILASESDMSVAQAYVVYLNKNNELYIKYFENYEDLKIKISDYAKPVINVKKLEKIYEKDYKPYVQVTLNDNTLKDISLYHEDYE